MTAETKEKMLERVRALIAKADSTDFPAEADAFRAKADALMLRHAISMHELKDPDQAGRAITTRDYDMLFYTTNPYNEELWTIMQKTAMHCRIQTIPWRYTGMTMPIVGTEADMDYFDLLFTNVSLEMSKGLEPKPSRANGLIENLVKMKEAGMKWERIGELLYGIDQLDEPYSRNTGVRFTKMYTDYCTAHDRPRLRTSPAVYQRSFVAGFTMEIGDRLARIRRESQAAYNEDHSSNATGLVLADMKQLVDARAREMFGDPPASRGGRARAANRKMDHGAVSAGREAAANVNLGNRKVGYTQGQLNQ